MSKYVCFSPVLVCGFNRPDLLANCLAHVRAVNPPRLYISIDGPRKKVKSDADLVEQCRQIARSVSWCSEVQLKIEPENLGCRRAMQSALDWFFEAEPEGIILEDDIEATPAFFSFCDTMLQRYRNEKRIASINGWTPVPNTMQKPSSLYLTKYSHVWGWATWRRSWTTTSQSAQSLSREDLRSGTLLRRSHGRGIDQFWWDRLRLAQKGRLDSWALIHTFDQARKGSLSVSPPCSLTVNAGFGQSSTHTSRNRGNLGVGPNLESLQLTVTSWSLIEESDLDWAHDKYHFGFGEGANYWPRFKSKVYYYLNIIPFGKKAIKAINRLR